MEILSFDCESNGLHGTPFAVGAVVIDSDTLTELARFTGYVDIRLNETIQPWVWDNVWPHIKALDFYGYDIRDLRQMRDEFWEWFVSWKKRGAFVVGDFCWPVEARFLSECIADDPDNRGFAGPYPLHELGTLLYASNIDPDIKREVYALNLFPENVFPIIQKHNPLDDALVAAWCAVKALRQLGLT